MWVWFCWLLRLFFFFPRHTAHQMKLGRVTSCGGTEFPQGWQQLAHAYEKIPELMAKQI